MKYIVLILVTLSFLSASKLTDEAYKAYKSKNYTKAVALYKKATKSGSLESRAKAEYNLGVFYLRGLGVKKSKQEALKHFRKSNLIAYGIAETLHKFYYSTQSIRVLRDTNRYLAKLETTNRRRQNAKKVVLLLNKELKKRRNDKKIEETIETNIKKDDLAFLRRCPAAKVVRKSNRKDLKILPCRFYRNYPKTVKRYFHERVAWSSAHKAYNDSKQLKIEKEMQKTLHPILRAYLKEKIACISKAKRVADLDKCQIDYLGRLDTLLFTNYTQNIADARHLFSSAKERANFEKEMQRALTQKERQKEIKKLREQLKSGRYVPNY